MEYRKLKDLNLLENNPRFIKDDDFKKLVKSIKDNPDYFEARPLILSDRTGKLVIIAGNQRYRAAMELNLKQVPTFLIKDLTEQREREIIIRDNVSNGNWDYDILGNDWDVDDLEEWGLDVAIDEKINKLEDGEIIEFEQSVQLEPPKEYILIMAEPNSVEWENLKETLKLKIVRRGGYKKGSAFDSISLERVLYWNDFKKRVNVDSDTK